LRVRVNVSQLCVTYFSLSNLVHIRREIEVSSKKNVQFTSGRLKKGTL